MKLLGLSFTVFIALSTSAQYRLEPIDTSKTIIDTSSNLFHQQRFPNHFTLPGGEKVRHCLEEISPNVYIVRRYINSEKGFRFLQYSYGRTIIIDPEDIAYPIRKNVSKSY